MEQEKLIASAQDEIIALRNVLEDMRTKPNSTKSTQSTIDRKCVVKKTYNHKVIQTQKAENKYAGENKYFKRVRHRLSQHYKVQNKIFLEAAHQGRDFSLY